ncbi:MAG TPA: radical SAM protein [Anaerolineaceae bacterium]|nr:radical SAM protein [Anaerolineaceae bacterium]
MRVREIQAKTILSTVPQPDPIFGLKYNLNLYRGCQHQCIYCDSRSECYQIEDFNHEVLVKANALELLDQELHRKRVKGTIGTGSMNDPYMPLEAERQLTRGALALIARHGFGVHVLTKSTLVRRDLDLLQDVSQVYAAVTLTITTADDALSRQLEPGAPPSSERFQAIRELAGRGLYTGVSLMPVLPFLEDTPENITAIIRQAAEAGASYIIPWISVTLRNRQREYFYQQLDRLFPGLRARYERAFGPAYHCEPPRARQLYDLLQAICAQTGLETAIRPYQPPPRLLPAQPTLF